MKFTSIKNHGDAHTFFPGLQCGEGQICSITHTVAPCKNIANSYLLYDIYQSGKMLTDILAMWFKANFTLLCRPTDGSSLLNLCSASVIIGNRGLQQTNSSSVINLHVPVYHCHNWLLIQELRSEMSYCKLSNSPDLSALHPFYMHLTN